MVLVYHEEAECEVALTSTLTNWLGYNYRGCYSASRTKSTLAKAKAWAWRSPTAQHVFKTVKSTDIEIHVVGMRGGFQCFSSTEAWSSKKEDPKTGFMMTHVDIRPTVFIDLDGQLTTNHRVHSPHNIRVHQKDLMTCAPEYWKGDVVAIDNFLALIHELGHAVQYIERPLMFDNHAKQQRTTTKALVANRQREGDAGDRSSTHEIKAASFGGAIHATAKAVLSRKMAAETPGNGSGESAILRKHREIIGQSPQQVKKQAYAVVIEQDNMSRHEWPVCDEMELPLRVNYRDIGGTSSGPSSETSQILADNRQRMEQERLRAAEKARRAAKASAGKTPCPKCGALFGAMVLRVHVGTCRGKA